MYSGCEFIFYIHSLFIHPNHNDVIEVIAMEKSEILAYVVLFIGVGLLVFTFFSAFLFLGEKLSLLSTDLMEAFGEVIGPLIETCIRIMYLGIMGWIGSIMTIRGVQLVTQLKREAKHAQEEKYQSTSTFTTEVAEVPEITERISKPQEQKERKKEG